MALFAAPVLYGQCLCRRELFRAFQSSPDKAEQNALRQRSACKSRQESHPSLFGRAVQFPHLCRQGAL